MAIDLPVAAAGIAPAGGAQPKLTVSEGMLSDVSSDAPGGMVPGELKQKSGGFWQDLALVHHFIS